MRVGEVAELWVYPVKSMRGLRATSVALDPEGIRGDRRFAIESGNAPSGKPLLTGRERATMLLHDPETVDGEHFIRIPGGDRYPLHSAALLQSFRNASDAANSFRLKASPAKPLTDVRPVSFISTTTLVALSEEMQNGIDPQRFRSNIILQLDDARAFAEDAWNGRVLRFGDGEAAAELLVRERIPRCRMVSLDPQTAEPDHTILKHLARNHDGKLGVYGTVCLPGMLEERQAVYLL